MNITLAAGEASGDQLGASLAEALNARYSSLALSGVIGPEMDAAGVRGLANIDQLNVMGLTEVVRHLPRLIQLRRQLRSDILDSNQQLFVGIDAPDFNLGLARQLKRQGLATAQWVAPSVWAWRRYRVRKIARSLDLLLTLFPFEDTVFSGTGLDVRYTGHPLADAIPMQIDRAAARAKLGLNNGATIIALLPGSRAGELGRHARLIADTATQLRKIESGMELTLLLANPGHVAVMEQTLKRSLDQLGVHVLINQTRTGLMAADCAVAASGTVTLEALLCKTPMTIFYQLNRSTYWLAQRLVKSRWIGLPNVLADDNLVPERLQLDANPRQLCDDVLSWIDQPRNRSHFQQRAEQIHQQLACSAAERTVEILVEKFGAILGPLS